MYRTLPNPFKLAPRIPENLEKAVENVIAKSEEVNYDPENDMNWMDLPKEMKKEIVERMDFFSRIQLGATAKDEKTLAEAKKYTLNSLEIYVDHQDATFRAYNIVGDRLLRNEFTVKKRHGSVEWFKKANVEIFKKCEIQSFCHKSYMIDHDVTIDVLRNFAPFTFKRYVCCEDWFMNTFVLENCENLESISIDAFRLKPESGFNYKSIFTIPSVRNAMHLELVNVKNLPALQKIVQEWLNSDAGIDKSMEVQMEEAGMIDSFAEKFQGKIAEKSAEKVRIRMEDLEKQILIQKVDNHNQRIANFLIKIIPTELPESEFKTVPFDKFKYSLPRFNIFFSYTAPKLPA